MQIQKVVGTDNDRVYMSVKNVNALTATTGFALRWVGGAAAEKVSTGAGQAVFMADAAGALAAGVAVEDIAVNAYGRVVAKGLVSVAYSFEADKTVPLTGIATGVLRAGALAGSFTSGGVPQALSVTFFKYAIAMTTTNISGGVPLGDAYVNYL